MCRRFSENSDPSLISIRTLIAFVLLFVCAGWNRENKPLFYSFSRGDSRLWLLGSVHLGHSGLFPPDSVVQKAWDTSERLVVELDVSETSPSVMFDWVIRKGMYPEEETIRSHLPSLMIRRLDSVLTYAEMDPQKFHRFRPWMICIQLSGIILQRQGLSTEWGVDQYFIRAARKKEIPVTPLETQEEQMQTLESLSTIAPVAILEWCLDDAEEQQKYPQKLMSCWSSGNIACLDSMIISSSLREPRMKMVRQSFFDRRNKKMVERLESIVADKKNAFVVVGTGHLLGEKGLVKLLTDKEWVYEASVSSPLPYSSPVPLSTTLRLSSPPWR